MIYVRIWEGLGNQLFQYAYARAVQLRNNEDVRLCALHGRGKRTFRQYELDKLAITLSRDKTFERIAEYVDSHQKVRELVEMISGLSGVNGYIEEQDVQYKEELKFLKGNYYVSGWLQNEKYFKEYEDIIRKEIRPKKKIKISKELKYILDNKETVSVHIRRGDFKKYNNLLSMDYYKKALDLIETQVENAYYVVFSDNLDWVKKCMQFDKDVYFVNEDKKLEDYEELFVMSKCKHNIVANSTFSWWGAWLNTNINKIVIGPEHWFARSKLNIMPESWIKI